MSTSNFLSAILSFNFTTLQTYFTTHWAAFAATGQLPTTDWNCSFSAVDWQTCLLTSWQWPVLLGLNALFDGIWRQGTSHWGFFATVGAPESPGTSLETGIHNVYTAWYVADAQVGAFYSFWESTVIVSWMIVLAGNMIYHNRTNYSSVYLYFGIIQAVAAYLYVAGKAIVFSYDVINSSYLQSRYLQDTWVTIQFGTIFNAFNETNEILQVLVYFEQLLLGNKRMDLYINTIMAIAASLHPITLPFSMYFWAQVPFQAILDFGIYIIWPQFDTPQVPWEEYFNEPSYTAGTVVEKKQKVVIK